MLPIKVMVNKEKSKVLFAEANSDFADVLISFLTLPLRNIAKILSAKDVFGSIGTLHAALSNMDDSYFYSAGVKEMWLDTASPFQQQYSKLKFDITCSRPFRFFLCEDASCESTTSFNVSMHRDIASCSCGKPLNRSASFSPVVTGGAFIARSSTFIVSDDLRVAPIASGILETLKKLGITDTQGAQLMHFNLDMTKLLEFSLYSATPLTDLIFKKSCSTTPNPEPGVLLQHPMGVASSKKMVLKLVMQKSTNKFLFAEATREFVEFLFSFLIIPLGGVVSLLGGNNCFRCIENLQRSVSDLIDCSYFVRPDIKTRLMKPKVAYGYLSYHRFLPLTEDDPPKIFLDDGYSVPYLNEKTGTSVYFKRVEKFFQEQLICYVDDNLNVTPSLATKMSVLNSEGIPLSDLEDMELHIGQEEALRILRVALTSKTVLTDALIKPMLSKLPKVKQES